ncbi:MAG: tRNA pseudouridine(38-40) synthase TruA [Clostridiales bacterium]|nr:tRNA pseudouridine(38-40) synthase TruA [Clostridiales bacterium]
MVNIKLIIEYDGGNYCGWQVQPNGMSVQQVIENAIFDLTSEKTRINGSGRTDSGVHAIGQTASFNTESTIPPEAFSKALNHHLPSDISIVSSCEVDKDFHARFSAIGKHYKYVILNRDTRSPLNENKAYRVGYKLDIKEMKIAALNFVGTHDFKGFMAAGSKVSDTIRTITEISVVRLENSIEINVKGTGFLYNMVRIIAGTLLECGIGKLKAKDIPGIILTGTRDAAGPTLPAHGLYLIEVFY